MKHLIPFLLATIVLASCKNDTKTRDSQTAKALPAEKIIAVCIRSGVPIREEPHKEGKWISSMRLGETALYLGETVVDSTDKMREYYKLELSDGTVQWARSYGIILNAKPAAVISETSVYLRPELVTKTDKSFKQVEFLVIVNEKAEWVEVVGSEKRKKGWIKKENLSTEVEDVAIATLAHKEIMDDNGNILPEKLPDFLNNIPYRNALLAVYLQQLLDKQVESAIEESIMDYEEQSVTDEETEEI